MLTRETYCPVVRPEGSSNQDGAPMSQMKIREAIVSRGRHFIDSEVIRAFVFQCGMKREMGEY
jgi:hypothetical protein